MKLPLWRVAEFIGAHPPKSEGCAAGYSIDSRTIQPGELFFAIKGERLNGHDYVEAALATGAVGAVVAAEEVKRFADKSRLLVVPDTLHALQQLGAAVRRLWGKTLIGVTGSAGKTSTKDFIAQVLGAKYRVLKSQGNLNNHFGLPLQLLKLEPEHEMAVIEMGMNHAGEIRELARIAQPNDGVVTTVAPVHLEFFGSVKEIARAKYELIESLPNGGVAVLNADNEYTCQFGRDFHGRVLMFGIEHAADVRAEDVREDGTGSRFTLVTEGTREPAHVPLLGKHNVLNSLAAVAVGLQHGISPSECVRVLGTLKPSEKRGEVIHLAGAVIINDCYNSNPAALNAMVDALASMPATRRIVIAGEMLELGPAAAALHAECARHMAEQHVDRVIAVRGLAKNIAETARECGIAADFVETPEAAGEMLAAELREGDAVLFKASRGVKLERGLDALQHAMKVTQQG